MLPQGLMLEGFFEFAITDADCIPSVRCSAVSPTQDSKLKLPGGNTFITVCKNFTAM